MNLDKRLRAVSELIPRDCILADIGTDHGYLPVWLLLNKRIKSAIAGDIVPGPCAAARATVARYGMSGKVQVRQGSGLKVLKEGEVSCIAIAGMGATTIVEIFEDSYNIAAAADRLVLQPMAGAISLRRWLCEHGWVITYENLIEDGKHFYEILSAERGESKRYTEAEYAIGPVLMAEKHPLLQKQFAKQQEYYRGLIESMSKSPQAVQTSRYAYFKELLKALEDLEHDYYGK